MSDETKQSDAVAEIAKTLQCLAHELVNHSAEPWSAQARDEISVDRAKLLRKQASRLKAIAEPQRETVPGEVWVVGYDGVCAVDVFANESDARAHGKKLHQRGEVGFCKRVPVHGTPEARDEECGECKRLSAERNQARREMVVAVNIAEHYKTAAAYPYTVLVCPECHTEVVPGDAVEAVRAELAIACDSCEKPDQWEKLHERVKKLNGQRDAARQDAAGWKGKWETLNAMATRVNDDAIRYKAERDEALADAKRHHARISELELRNRVLMEQLEEMVEDAERFKAIITEVKARCAEGHELGSSLAEYVMLEIGDVDKLCSEKLDATEMVKELERKNNRLLKMLGERCSCDYLRRIPGGDELECVGLKKRIAKLEAELESHPGRGGMGW